MLYIISRLKPLFCWPNIPCLLEYLLSVVHNLTIAVRAVNSPIFSTKSYRVAQVATFLIKGS